MKGLMYGSLFNTHLSARRYIVSTKFHYFKIVRPASPYSNIIIPPCGIIIYDLAGGNILKKRNVVDPTIHSLTTTSILIVLLKDVD
jgi:hypothetical protein